MIVGHSKKTKPNILSNDRYNEFCSEREKMYMDVFLKSIFSNDYQ